MILHTGLRTDIPAFYSEWFVNRLREGFVLVRNPYNPIQVTKYQITPDVVDVISFCTKNPAPMLPHMELLKDYEIVFYMLNSEKAKLLSYEEALDNEIMQKILPRIQGSGAAIKELLCDLFKKFAGDYSGISQESAWKQMKAYIETNEKNCKYKKSAEKICYMMRRFEEDGFTSYWL